MGRRRAAREDSVPFREGAPGARGRGARAAAHPERASLPRGRAGEGPAGGRTHRAAAAAAAWTETRGGSVPAARALALTLAGSEIGRAHV